MYKPLIVGASIIVAPFLPACTMLGKADPIPAPTAEVLRVIDGDTIAVKDEKRGRLKVRIIGLNSPEVHRPGWSVGCYGPEASEYAKSMLAGQKVSLVSDPRGDQTDIYGRTLAEVFLSDGRNFAVESVRTGHAKAYVFNDRPSKWAPEIAAAEQQARESRAGLWGAPCNGEVDSEEIIGPSKMKR